VKSLMTPAEAASTLRLTVRAVAGFGARGTLTRVRLPGGSYRYTTSSVTKLLALLAGSTAKPVTTDVAKQRVQAGRRPLCRLCRWDRPSGPAWSCHHCGLMVCEPHLEEHMRGIDWPVDGETPQYKLLDP
jgi:hypothetical protein